MRPARPPSPIALHLARQGLVGCGVGLGCALLMLATDTAGIRSLITASAYPVTTGVIFLAGAVITFVPLVVATAIGLLGPDDEV